MNPKALTRELADVFRPPALRGGPAANLARAMHIVRLVVVAAAIVLSPFLPGATAGRRALLAGLLTAYLPFAFALFVVTKKRETPLTRIGAVVADLATTATFAALFPQVRMVCLLGFLLLVAVHASIGGIAAGVIVSTAGLGLAIGAQHFGVAGMSLDGFTLAMFAVSGVGLSLMLDRAGREQRHTLSLLDDTRRGLAEAQHLASLGSWRWDVTTDTVSWSDELYRVFSIPPEGFDGTYSGFLRLVHEGDRAAVDEAVRRSVETGESIEVEHRALLIDGRVRWIHTRGRIVRDAEGRTEAMFGTGQDVTERHELESLKHEFLSGVSHELRTPLTAIRGFASMMEEQDLDEATQREFISRIGRNAGELEQLIEQLLDYSRLEAGWRRVAAVPVPLHPWASEFVDAHSPALATHTVKVAVPDDLKAMADEHALSRIVGNLIDNAVKFSPAGTTITLAARPDGGRVIVTVADEGPGIPADQQAKIFEPFFQGSRTAARRGTGMGLAVASRYTEMLGGRLWVESEVGKGTAFSLSLPTA